MVDAKYFLGSNVVASQPFQNLYAGMKQYLVGKVKGQDGPPLQGPIASIRAMGE